MPTSSVLRVALAALLALPSAAASLSEAGPLLIVLETDPDATSHDFELTDAGTYDVHLRLGTVPSTRRDGPAATPLRLRVDDGAWIALTAWPAADGAWTATTERDRVRLDAGAHRLEVKGDVTVLRALLLRVDTPTETDAEDVARALRALDAARDDTVQAHPPEIPAEGVTPVRLDAAAWTGVADPSRWTYEWNAPGALSLHSDATGAVADALFEGGTAQPVRIIVKGLDGVPVHSASFVIGVQGVDWDVSGQPIAWHPIEIRFDGPGSNELATDPNPFLDFRLNVTLTSAANGQQIVVPGFFDGDGEGGGAGDVWKARFAAPRAGVWTFEVSFRAGDDVAVDLDPTAGSPSHFNGLTGQFAVARPQATFEGFLGRGPAKYVGSHYLRFPTRKYFIKGGTDSPENFLGYRGFDDVQDLGNLGVLHRYEAHVGDWEPGDPYFVSSSTGWDSKGIIGALNYLSSVGVNSIYFLPMNLGGDGRETCPFVGYAKTAFNKTHYDISRMHQWNQVLDHAQRKGIKLHVVLAETESGNEQWLDDGAFGVERKLFFRELVARFGHALVLKWNLCEEADFFGPDTLRAHADYIRALDPYDHPVAVHTFPHNVDDYEQYMGENRFSASSIQYVPDNAGAIVEEWRANSAAAGHKWLLDMDENNPPGSGLTPFNSDDLRKRVLYDVYFSGGQIEWYSGGSADQGLEEFRSREDMWIDMRNAREFMEDNLTFWTMEPHDELVTGESGDHGGAEVFAKLGNSYAIYLPRATATGTLDLTGHAGEFERRWFNPRTGEFEGEVDLVMGDAHLALGSPPSDADEDWVCWVRKHLTPGQEVQGEVLNLGGDG